MSDLLSRDPNHLSILPVSVLDVAAQKKRQQENHSTTSSRSNYSPFPTEVADLCFEYFMRDAKVVFDPFAGWGERGEAAKKWEREYVGFDLSPTAAAVCASKGVNITIADSRTAPIPSHNGLVTCPPYWNLEKYEGGGLSDLKTWEYFIEEYGKIWNRVYEAAAPNSVYCVMVGEWRKNHIYYDLEFETRNIFKNMGAVLFDSVIVSRKKTSKIKIMLPQAKRLGYTVRVHETLLVYRKPN